MQNKFGGLKYLSYICPIKLKQLDMRNEIKIQVDWDNVATELPPIPTERGEGRRAPQESVIPNSK